MRKNMLRQGDILNDTFLVMDQIGKGGNGLIFRGFHLRLKKDVVIKRIRDDYPGDVSVEANILKRLRHRYLPQVCDFIQLGTEIYTVMDYIEGEDLGKYLERGCWFQEETLIFWLYQLCDVLEYLHSRRPPILHSDIKPANIMVTPSGDICLIDFNVSLEEDGSNNIRGLSQEYAAPEQKKKAMLAREGKDHTRIVLDERMDIYSLGMTFYSLMTGLRPDPGTDRQIPLTAYDLGYSSGLIHIVSKMIAPDRRRRYPSAAALRESLQQIEKSDSRYLRYRLKSRLLNACCLLFAGAGIFFCIYGNQALKKENFERDYSALTESYERMDTEETVDQGIRLLNESSYQSILKREQEEKGVILYCIAESYYEQENYAAAVDYYREAADCDPYNENYYTGYASAAARQGNLTQASRALETAEMYGMNDRNAKLIQAEIAAAEQDYITADTLLGELLEQELEDRVREQAVLLALEISEYTGSAENGLNALEASLEREEEGRFLRQAGKKCMELADGTLAGEERTRSLSLAETCYQKLLEQGNSLFNDRLNLAIVYEMQGKYEASQNALNQLKEEDGENYEIYMYLAYVSYELENQKPQDERNYTNTLACCTNAVHYYGGRNDDERMNQLLELQQRILGMQQQ